ncbi:hypothetical protein HD806DRAFT_94651 [Xylariaceae sp. AK1471]|nr:hypothetical protein HD806DRAFT_94651 [Xylariaceae sp. AK1471]
MRLVEYWKANNLPSLGFATLIAPFISPSGDEGHGKDFPQSTEEARCNIERIRADKLASYNGLMVEDFENALDVISNDLYANPLHFLLELLQNADDNAYGSATPKIWITYDDGNLRFDTNELGFRRADVEAICSIGKSSKKVEASKKETKRIGEKGIGFKAVFKVAEEAFIKSGFYSFKFTNKKSSGTHGALGRLAPVWADFPGHSPEGLTSILLKLRKDVDCGKLVEGIKKFDAKLLMFLNKVKEVDIQLLKPPNPVDSSSKIKLRREDSTDPDSGLPLRTLVSDTSSPYIVFHYQISSLPYEEKRNGCDKSELVLAFPHIVARHPTEQQDDSMATSETHKVYSFLPIRDYGFKFVLQADFILVANRQEIDPTRQWNHALSNGIPAALLEFVTRLNASDLRYYWPLLFPVKAEPSSFFQDVWTETLRVFSNNATIEETRGTFMLPSELWSVPLEFADTHRQGTMPEPLIPPAFSKFRYVSPKYPATAKIGLESLGVKTISAQQFLEELSDFISKHSHKVWRMPKEWHSRLSGILDRLTADHKEMISSLCFVPVQDGTWIAPQCGPLLFPLEANSLTIPKKIGYFVVHMDAAEDRMRKTLLRKLGAQDANHEEICRIIIEAHSSKGFTPEDIERDDLLCHAEFLYLAGWQRQKSTDHLWVMLEDGSRRLSAQTYLDSEIPYSASQVFGDHRSKFPFLHAEYYTIFDTLQHREWLRQNLGLAIVPRLVNPHDSQASFNLSPDFRFLIENIQALEVLQLLKTNWKFYRDWIIPTENPEYLCEENTYLKKPHERIKAVISLMRVDCRDKRSVQLNQTCLPRKDILTAFALPDAVEISTSTKTMLAVLPVPDPESPDWDILQQFNVMVKVDFRDLIIRLQQIKEGSATKEEVSLLYERIEDSTNGKKEVIMREFQEKRLIFIPSGGDTPVWIGPDHCVWNGPSSLRKTQRLKEHYPERELLFRRTLRIAHATVRTLITEAKQISANDSLSYICGLLKELSIEVDKTSKPYSSDGWGDLDKCCIFPIWTRDPSPNFDHLGTASKKTQNNEWYIADHPYLRMSFEGRVPLLALDAANLDKTKSLIEYIGCGGRRLSRLVEKDSAIEGEAKLDDGYTTSLQRKWRYIASLIPVSKPGRLRLGKQIQLVQVFQVQGISSAYKLRTSSGAIVQGRREDGQVMLDTDTAALKIFITSGKAKIGQPPRQLINELQGLCGIADNHLTHLFYILMSENVYEIEGEMSRDGLLDNVLDFLNADSPVAKVLAPKGLATLGLKTVQISAPILASRLDVTGDTKPNPKSSISLLQGNLGIPPRQISVKGSTSLNTQSSNFTESGPSGGTATGRLLEDNRSVWGLGAYTNRKAYWGHVPPLRKVKRALPKGRKRGLVSLSMPITMLRDNLEDEEDQFIAELHVNDFLRGVLQDAYTTQEHWTSNMRRRAGHKPFDSSDLDISTFTIADTSSRLRVFMKCQGYQVESLAANTIFHIQVVCSQGPVSTTFKVGPAQVAKAERLSFASNNNQKVRNEVFILAFVPSLYIDPEIALILDPWQMKLDGILSLETFHEYEGCLTENAPILYVGHNREHIPVPGSSGEQSTYRYQELKHREIRVLQLLPGKSDEPVNVSIRHISIDDLETFWAISYAWGKPMKNIAPTYLYTPAGKILITLSLDSALRALRDKGVDVLLWADAISINQDNLREKALQIRLMGKIFESAERVVAWLGEEYEGSHEALEVVSQFWLGKVPDRKDTIWEDINSLVRRPWFERAWIVQELVLPSKVILMCGHRSEVDWDHFFEGLIICEELNAQYLRESEGIMLLPHAGPAYALGQTRHKKKNQANRTGFSLMKLLDMFAHTQATLEVDKLFALLALADDAADPLFSPDYDSPLEEIVRRYARGFVANGQTMELLYRAGVSKSCNFCSWIPRLTHCDLQRTISDWDAAREFHAGQSVPPVAQYDTGGYLHVKGYVFDTIQQTYPTRLGNGRRVHCNEALADLRRLLLYYAQDYPTGEMVEDLLIRLPIGDARRPHLETTANRLRGFRGFTSQPSEDAVWPPETRRLVLGLSVEQNTVRDSAMARANQRIVSQYWSTVAAFASRLGGAVFCGTRRRYVGFVPGLAKMGDRICLLDGGRVPFLLRPEEGGMYSLVGEAYIHGIMQGQALKQCLQKENLTIK